MGLLDLPRDTTLPNLKKIRDRKFCDKVKRVEKQCSMWQSEAQKFAKMTSDLVRDATALADEANRTQDYAGATDDKEKAEFAAVAKALSLLIAHLDKFD